MGSPFVPVVHGFITFWQFVSIRDTIYFDAAAASVLQLTHGRDSTRPV
jgi:hypothetical protein